MTSKTIDVPPDVARISEGLRDTGYEFNTAVADIIDNSISAGATVVDIRMGLDFMGSLSISIGDNGCGMNEDGLINAMKYGSKKRDDPASLGKFGMGLKTASTAFCRRLSLVSRDINGAEPIRATWDLDFLNQSNGWGLELATPAAHELQILKEVCSDKSGTVVLWEKIDRILLGYQNADAKPLRNAMRRLENSLKEHIATVYQRFLDPKDTRERTLEIKVNEIHIQAWDPFCVAETGSPAIEQVMPVQLESRKETSFKVRVFILPRKEEFTDKQNRIAAKISNDRQGVYIYRENRLIHGPDWLGMYKKDPHFSLIRVELSFDHNLDDAFQVDIKKSRILMNETLYNYMRDKFFAAPRREAEMRYRKGAAATAKGAAALLHSSSGSAIQQKVSGLKVATIGEVDQTTGEAQITNNSGQSMAKLHIITTDEPVTIHVSTSETLDNGVLWEASLVNGGAGVTLNTGHPYYPKAYLPNKTNRVVIQALDFLLWSLAQAELNNISDDNRDAFEEFRIEVSRNLKKLVADLPDAIDDETA